MALNFSLESASAVILHLRLAITTAGEKSTPTSGFRSTINPAYGTSHTERVSSGGLPAYANLLYPPSNLIIN